MKKVLEKFEDLFDIQEGKGKQYATAFELLACSVAFDISPFQAVQNSWNYIETKGKKTTDGDDGKVDGYSIRIDEKDKVIFVELMQAKYKDSVKTNEIEPFFNSVNNYIIGESKPPKGYKSLKKVNKEIDKITKQYETHEVRYKLHVVFIGNDNSIQDLKKNTTDKFDSIFEEVSEGVDYVIHGQNKINLYIEKMKKRTLNRDYKDVSTSVNFENKASPISNKESNLDVYVSVLKAKEIIKIIDKEFTRNFDLSRLFNGNVRGFLTKSDVNDDIRRTIENNPYDMLALNNGAVIYCESINYRQKRSYILKNPVIINGQQTISSLYKLKDLDFGDKIAIQVKFISLKNGKDSSLKKVDIAKASNTMNQIQPIDLVANTSLMDKIRKVFFESGIYINAKNGEVLNEVFVSEVKDVVEIFQWFSTVYGLRPDVSKTRARLIRIFHDAYFKLSSKYSSLVEYEDLVSKAMYRSYELSNFMLKFQNMNKERVKKYFEHAKHFILFVIIQKYGVKVKFTDINHNEVLEVVETQIARESKRKSDKKEEFTLNNYFKSMKPTTDYYSNEDKEIKTDFVENVLEMLNL